MIAREKIWYIYGLSYVIFMCLTGSLFAQENAVLERIHFRTDRDLYVVGESIHFKAFMLNGNNPAQYSDILYLELIDKHHSPVVQKKFAISEKECDGSFSLPSELSSGNFYLRAYTSWMKNSGHESFAFQLITVINPFEVIASELLGGTDGENKTEPDANIHAESSEDIHTESHEDIHAESHEDIHAESHEDIHAESSEDMDTDPPIETHDIEIRVGIQNDYNTTRQKISLDIEAKDSLGNPVEGSFLLSIARKGMLESGKRNGLNPPSRQVSLAKQEYPPEWRGHYITGKIQPQNGGGSFMGDTLLYSVVGKRATINYCISDDQGNFGFLVDNLQGRHEVVIQNLNPGKSGYRINFRF